MNFLSNIKYKFKNANIVEKLIYINVSIFIVTLLLNTFGLLFKNNTNFIINWFALNSDYTILITKPWSIISYGFLHNGFLHIFINLVALFFIGNLFIEYFTPKQLLNFYIFGSVFGGIIFIVGYNYLPLLKEQNNSNLVGASAGVSAILTGIATYIPNYQLKFRFIGFVKIWYIAVVWIILDFIQLAGNNAGGHLAHLGGALFGFLFVYKASNKKIDLFNFFKKKKSNLKTVYKTDKKTKKSTQSQENQEKIDTILDKISKSGYDSLTQKEKEFLFKQGQK